MPYEGTVRRLLDEAGAAEGDEVQVTVGERVHRGIVMPHHAFSDPGILTLKLASGYNVGIRLEGRERVERVGEAPEPPHVVREGETRGDLPRVALLGTGGTIASYVDYRTGAVHPATTAEELAFATPELFDVAQVEARVLFQTFSEDLGPEHWSAIAEAVVEAFDDGVQGVVVPHGTDTLGYTAAALSFLLRDLPGPVVLVGAQRSSDRPSTDAHLNLRAAVRVAAHADLGEVVACMHATVSDDRCALHRGTRVRKMHTSRRDAFQSVNAAPLGHATPDVVELGLDHRPRAQGPARVVGALDPSVRLVTFHPGLDVAALPGPEDAAGLVLAGTGLGHVASRLVPSLLDLVNVGVPVVMTSQCLHGRTNLRVYSTGRDLLAAGVLPAGDMLPETALVKLMWAVGSAGDADEARRLFLENVAGEASERTEPGTFPVPPREVDP